MNGTELQRFVLEIASLPNETEWVEFKRSKADPKEIGMNISALSNALVMIKPHGEGSRSPKDASYVPFWA